MTPHRSNQVEVVGVARFHLQADPQESLRLHVRLIQADLADEESIDLCAASLKPEPLSIGENSIPFCLLVRDPPCDRGLMVGHLSLDGSPTVERGDHLTTRSYPVDLTAQKARVDLELQPVH